MRHLPCALWLVAACHHSTPDTDRDTTTGDTGPVVTLPWAYAIPDLDGDELVPGHAARLWIDGLPALAQVTFYQSNAGMYTVDCDPETANCAAIVDGEVYGEATGDVLGHVEFSVDIPQGAHPDVVFFQAQVTDPETGAAEWSYPIQRQVNVSPEDALISLDEHTHGAGISVFTYGNSHTGGVCWFDYNGDLLPDLFVTNGGGLNHKLYRNNGDGTFADASLEVRKPNLAIEDAAAVAADIDNDGDVDLLVVADSPVPMDSESVQPREGGPNQLYVNQGDGTFTEEAASRGLVDPRGWRNITGVFADFDGDGDVDVHLGTWAMNQPGTDRYGRLLLNDGTGHFTDSGQHLGYGRDVLTSLAADLDGDGHDDLYLGNVNKIVGFVGANPLADDVMYRNDGSGVMRDITGDSPGVGDDAWAAMGLDVGDIDNDGDFDLYEADRWEVPDPLPRGNTLYLNNGDGTFTDNKCDVAGICTGYASWPTQFADFDRDGWVDLWVGTGKDFYPDLVYLNNRDGTFTSNYLPSMVNNAVRGSAIADYDGDGDVDLFLWNLGANAELYVNNPRDDHHWLEVKLIGRTSNRMAVGAVIHTTSGAVHQMRRVSGGDGAHSQSDAIVHFGLGTSASPVDLDIVWPGGHHQLVANVPADRLVQIDEADGMVPNTLEGVATWSAATGDLTVTARSSYGGRTRLSTPYGPLGWDPDQLQFAGTFPAVGELDELTVTDPEGHPFALAVAAIP